MAGAKPGALPYYEKWFVLGLLIGVFSGLLVLVFHMALTLVERLFLGELVGMQTAGGGPPAFEAWRYYLLPASMAIGALIAAFFIYTFAPEAQGSGTDMVIKAYHYLQGKIRWRVLPVKIIATVFTIGSGGSGGAEGPAAQFSAALGSMVSELLGLPPEDRRRMAVVGLGAGIGAIFKAPIGGALLAAEVLYRRDLEPDVIYPALVASAVSYAVYGAVTGYTPIFGYYTEPLDPMRLPLYAILGAFAGLVAIAYVEIFNASRRFFERLNVNVYLRPAAGALLASAVALIAPQVVAYGYSWVRLAELGDFSQFYSPLLPTLALLALMPLLKILATSFTVGSGGSGGLFAPAIFIGAFLGADVGLLFHYLSPSLAPSVAPFAIVGMAAVLAAATKTPLSALALTVELTGSVQLFPAMMLAVAISYILSEGRTIFEAQVPTRRESPAHRGEYEIAVLEAVKVEECALDDVKVLATDNVEKALRIMEERNMMGLPVVDDGGNFLGVVHLVDLLKADRRDQVVKYVIRGAPYVTPSSTLEQALQAMSAARSRWVSVVENGKFKGVLTAERLYEAYRKELKLHKAANRHGTP